jgi:hypothetical protein
VSAYFLTDKFKRKIAIWQHSKSNAIAVKYRMSGSGKELSLMDGQDMLMVYNEM